MKNDKQVLRASDKKDYLELSRASVKKARDALNYIVNALSIM
jgi:hypothetical protein